MATEEALQPIAFIGTDELVTETSGDKKISGIIQDKVSFSFLWEQAGKTCSCSEEALKTVLPGRIGDCSCRRLSRWYCQDGLETVLSRSSQDDQLKKDLRQFCQDVLKILQLRKFQVCDSKF